MAIAGIGIDRVVIARVEASMARFGDRFEQRIFTAGEADLARAKGSPARRLAMFFAAKEAVVKALGTGFSGGIGLRDIETRYLPSGKPEIALHGEAAAVAARLGVEQVHISLTDDGGIAMAFAVAE